MAFVGDSILGKSARIGSGTILANRRFDQKNIGIRVNGIKYDINVNISNIIPILFFGMKINICHQENTYDFRKH